MDFCHLHLHSEKSLLDGYGSAKAYIARAKELGFKYIGVTDHGNIDNLIEWQNECDKADMHPVLGCEAYIIPDRFIKQKGEKRGHITILIKNQSGLKSLCSMLTEANLTGFYYRPRIDYQLLLNHDISGLVIMTACAGSFTLLPGADDILEQVSEKTDTYFEIMPHKIKAQTKLHNHIKKLSEKFPSIPFCATNDCHYINEDDWESQEMLLAINSRAKWNDPKRWTFGFKGLYLRTEDEMIDAFKDQGEWSSDIIDQAMKNTVKVARKCMDFRIQKQDISLPEPPSMHGSDENELINNICHDGYLKLFGTDKWDSKYLERYEEEIKLITDKKFIRYFLIVFDLIKWARKNDIMVGPGRGSVGGSFVAYLMGITQVDPIKFNLLFSRFINESRHDLPDIDLDFEKRHRGKVVEYLSSTYGEDNTCGISTIMSMKSKGSIRDVCRVMEIPSKETSSFASSIWGNQICSVQDSIDNTHDGKAFAKKYPDVTKLILKMEGQARGAGAHAAAVIISNDDLTDTDKCVLVRRNKRTVCNWGMSDSEYVGLMKLDILGLSTLSVLAEAKRLIDMPNNPQGFYHFPKIKNFYQFVNHMKRELQETYDGVELVDFDFNKIPLNDRKAFKLITDGNTAGIFQMSGYSCTEFCKKMKINSFNDIVAAIALARPGPADSGMADEYVDRKHGKEWEPRHPIYEKITKDTYGVVCYQEQIMKVISEVAGLSESVADKIRKVIGKKRDEKEFQPFWESFRDGCKKMDTFSENEAKDFWEELKKHASYSFNKSHSVAYALIGYWTAYLKANCPSEFYAAALTFNEFNEKSRDGNKHKDALITELKEKGYKIISPKREKSDAIKWVCGENKTFYTPFIEIAGVGDTSALKCIDKKTPIKQSEPRLKGFFNVMPMVARVTKGTKLDGILRELEVDLDDIPSAEILHKYIPHINYF